MDKRENKMMMSRLMDLVVLVAELSQKSGKSFRELSKELMVKGYSAEEVEQALSWISSRKDVPAGNRGDLYGKRGVRVLSHWERVSLGPEYYRYLLKLLRLGVIDGEQFERIMARVAPFGLEKIKMSEIKEVACSVIFNLKNPDKGEDLFEVLDEEFFSS